MPDTVLGLRVKAVNKTKILIFVDLTSLVRERQMSEIYGMLDVNTKKTNIGKGYNFRLGRVLLRR